MLSAAPEAVYGLRKRCKELRYVPELFADVCRPGRYRTVVKDLKVANLARSA